MDLEGFAPRRDPIPEVGERTAEILTELGYDASEIQHLREVGAI